MLSNKHLKDERSGTSHIFSWPWNFLLRWTYTSINDIMQISFSSFIKFPKYWYTLWAQCKLHQTDGSPVSCPSTYRCLVGSLLYLTMTRSNISYAVQIISQFVSNPYTTHLAAVQCILQYLRGTPSHGLLYSARSPLTLQSYADADRAWCSDTR